MKFDAFVVKRAQDLKLNITLSKLNWITAGSSLSVATTLKNYEVIALHLLRSFS